MTIAAGGRDMVSLSAGWPIDSRASQLMEERMRQFTSYAQLFDGRSYAVGAVAAILTALAIGVPTAVIPNSLFTRMTPTRPQDYLFLALTALLVGFIVATYVTPIREQVNAGASEGRLTLGGLLSFLAVGCPICNKLIVLALGISGALRYFAPIQPLLGVASLALLGVTAWTRLRTLRTGCAVCAR